jgi:hypothetical protein
MSTSRRTQRAPIRSPTSIRLDRLDLPTVIADVTGSDDAASAGVMPTPSTRRFGPGVTIGLATGTSALRFGIEPSARPAGGFAVHIPRWRDETRWFRPAIDFYQSPG